ncbi:MAG TPA: carboxypeptidase regulatory-like domain-containing protein [Vicinamibacterales bacterium]|nr:carboxypeptidase regulatory-like domain-containing protein [Vicinamibacterales bacterium]
MRRFAVALLAGLFVLVAIPGFAQEGISTLKGNVVDQQGGVLPGVTVVVTHMESGVFRQVVSNADGSYFVTGLIPGRYRIAAELSGFKKYERPNVQLEVGKTVSLDLTLEVGTLEETVTVTSAAPLIDLTAKSVGGNVSESEMTELPNPSRNALVLVGLMPGVVVSRGSLYASDNLSVNGQSNTNNNFMVDGAGNQDDYLGADYGGQTRTAIESVQEFQVLTGQFDAEFGRTTGAVVNAVTKSGTNQFRGSAVSVFTNASITAKDFLVKQNNLAKPETSKLEWGATLGGPIVKDKAHFFYSIERVLLKDPRRNTFAVRPELDYATTQETKVWNHLWRFDHQVNANNTWGIRHVVEWSPTYDQISGRITLASKVDEKDLDRTTVGTWNSVFSNTRFNTFKASTTYENNGFASTEYYSGTPQDQLPPRLSMLTFTDGTTTSAGARINKNFEANDTFSWFVPSKTRGEHQLKMGVQFIMASIALPSDANRNGTFSFSTDRAFDANDPSTYPERFSILVPDGSTAYQRQYSYGMFLQDKWRLTDLTIDIGLRYDLEITKIQPKDNPLMTPGQYPVDKNNLGPRIGFAWNPGGSTTSVVRGGYGMFFEKTRLGATAGFVSPSSTVFTDSFTATFPTSSADPGPSQGQMPTNPYLVNGPVVNWALLNQTYPSGSTQRNTGTVYLDNPDRHVPYIHQVSIGYQRQLAQQLSGSVDFVHSWTRDQLITFNLNPGVRVNTSRTGRINYTDLYDIAGQLGISPFVNPVLTRQNVGTGQYSGLNFQLEKRYANNWSARVSYALGFADANFQNGNQTDTNLFQYLDDPRLDLAKGPSSFNRRHNFVVSGRLEVPKTHGMTVSGTYRYMTGTAFTLLDTTFDLDQNGILFDPIPAGDYCGVGTNPYCVTNKGGKGGAYGPNYTQTDMRFGWRFRPRGNATLDAYFEVFNILGQTNWANPSGDKRENTFLLLTALYGANGYPRQGQVGIRLGF